MAVFSSSSPSLFSYMIRNGEINDDTEMVYKKKSLVFFIYKMQKNYGETPNFMSLK